MSEELEAAEKAAKEKEEAEKKAAEEKLKAEEEAKKQKDFDSWLAKQPEDVRSLYDEHIGGLKSALEKEREMNKTNKGALDKLSKFEEAERQRKEAEMTETEKLQLQISEKEKSLTQIQSELEQLKLNEKKREIAEEVGLPTLFALRIQGTTPEEMKADAMVLLGAIPKIKTTINATNPGNNSLSDKETDEERRKRLGLSR
ncbi:MAG: hypothetical protein WC554_00245 [Clostridia bacterium]